MGIEPTDRHRGPTDGFEDRGGHQPRTSPEITYSLAPTSPARLRRAHAPVLAHLSMSPHGSLDPKGRRRLEAGAKTPASRTRGGEPALLGVARPRQFSNSAATAGSSVGAADVDALAGGAAAKRARALEEGVHPQSLIPAAPIGARARPLPLATFLYTCPGVLISGAGSDSRNMIKVCRTPRPPGWVGGRETGARPLQHLGACLPSRWRVHSVGC